MPWHIDRSRIEAGRLCPRKRALGYSIAVAPDEDGLLQLSGYGLGLSSKAKSISRETGTAVHRIFEQLLLHAADSEAATGVAGIADLGHVIEGIILTAVTDYREEVEAFLRTTPERAEEILAEQAWLIQCLGWLLALKVLPTLLEDFMPVEAEREEAVDLSAGRIRFASRPDALLRHRNSGRLVVVDLKTRNMIDNRVWLAKWETNPQLMSGVRAVNTRLQAEGSTEECSSYYVLALQTGKREPDKKQGDFSDSSTPGTSGARGPDRQQSPLCYAYTRQLGIGDREWRPSYWTNIVDTATGEVRREGCTEKRGWTKEAVWTLGMPAREFIQQVVLPSPDFMHNLWRLIGPIECREDLVDSWFTGVEAEEEQRWIPLAAALAAIGTGQQQPQQGSGRAVAGGPGGTTLRLLDTEAPQNWDACFAYGPDYVCQFRKVCMRDPGALEEFETRVPHHAGEAADAEEV